MTRELEKLIYLLAGDLRDSAVGASQRIALRLAIGNIGPGHKAEILARLDAVDFATTHLRKALE